MGVEIGMCIYIHICNYDRFALMYGGDWASHMTLLVKNLCAVQETWVRSLGWEDALEEEMVTHCSTLAWRIPWLEKPGGL